VSTAERARVVRRVVRRVVSVLGAITLNAAAGGLNPVAVEIAAREGARIVWLPTVDAVNEASAKDRAYPEGARIPLWVQLQRELRDAGVEPSPVAVLDRSGEPLPALLDILKVVARHRIVLATGHLSREEIFAVTDAALAAGVSHIVITHPEFPAQNLSIGDQVALADRGALLYHAARGQVQPGACFRRHPRDGRRAQPALHRPRPARQPAGRGWPCSVRRPVARSRFLRVRCTHDDGPQQSAARRSGGRMSRRLMVIGAHAADFVWRAGGAIAMATRAGGEARVVALSYGERGESGELWKQEGQTLENVKRIRHAEAEQATATLGGDFLALDFGDHSR
jgi:hypothetical protein